MEKRSYFDVGRILNNEEWESLTIWRKNPDNNSLIFKPGDKNPNNENLTFQGYSKDRINGERWKSKIPKKVRVEGPKFKSPSGKYTKFLVGRVLTKSEYESLKKFNVENPDLKWVVGEVHPENPDAVFLSYSLKATNGEYWGKEDLLIKRRENQRIFQKIKRSNFTEEDRIKEREKNRRPEFVEKRKISVKRRLSQPLNKIARSIRSSIYRGFKLKKVKKGMNTENILGMSFEEFRLYIESLFEPWMSWENYGSFLGGYPTGVNQCWDLDHIIPLSVAKTEEDLMKLSHYSNFQPLCSYTNRNIKGDSLNFSNLN